jgi:glutamate-ammonia-ligase adenylyltransferase
VNWISSAAEGTLDPRRVENALERIAHVWPGDYPALEEVIETFAAGRGALTALLAVSPVSAEKMVRDPGALSWLSGAEVCACERGPVRMRRALEKEQEARGNLAGAGFDPEFRALRRVKNREMLRIALRDVGGLSGLEETMAEITCVAELCLREVSDSWLAECARRWGMPGTEFCVMGMGKLGGQELNYSSDIDVMFLYGEDGALNPRFTYHEFFTRVAEKIVGAFAAASAEGALFRMDVRLRPEGSAGPLARSLESMENYYAGYGETWERMALMKARGVAGSEELFYEFTHQLQPFVYPRSLSPDVLDEVAEIKRRIERDIVGEAELTRNVKLGRGGIREIEFVAQAQQLMHGARHAFTQKRGTLETLRALTELSFINGEELRALSEAYRFLRAVEHRLQMVQEAQTHTVPEAGPERLALAWGLGFAEEAMFDRELAGHMGAVRGIFEKFLHSGGERAVVARDLGFFQDVAAAERDLGELGGAALAGHVSPRTRKLYGKLEPPLVAGLRGLADPDVALKRFVRFVERYGIRGLLFETLVTNPRVLDLLLRLFDASRFLTDIVMRRPQLVEETTRTRNLGRELDVAGHLERLGRREETRLSEGDWVRVYRRAQILRIGLRDLLGLAGVSQVQREYTALAEACMLHMMRALGLDDRLTVVGMGKFGGREVSYGCDLDVVLVGDDAAAAAELVKGMTAQTAEGIVFPVDARLRPEGKAGLLAIPLEGYRRYFQNRAQLWEAQALTKARPIAGPQHREFEAWARDAWAEFGNREDVLGGVRRMHERVVRERAGKDGLLAFKTGVGGLMELEFHVQALQMRHAIWEPNTVRALVALAEAGAIPPAGVAEMETNYLFLRRCEAVIRRVDNSSLSTLPADEGGQRQVGVRVGFAGREDFLTRYKEARERIHAWCTGIT